MVDFVEGEKLSIRCAHLNAQLARREFLRQRHTSKLSDASQAHFCTVRLIKALAHTPGVADKFKIMHSYKGARNYNAIEGDRQVDDLLINVNQCGGQIERLRGVRITFCVLATKMGS